MLSESVPLAAIGNCNGFRGDDTVFINSFLEMRHRALPRLHQESFYHHASEGELLTRGYLRGFNALDFSIDLFHDLPITVGLSC